MTSDPLQVPAPDLGAAAASAERRGLLPAGALGEFAAVADTLAALRGAAVPPITPASVRLTVFAGDHGIAAQDVSADLPEATRRRAADLASGTGYTALLAHRAAVGVTVIDLAIDSDDEIGGVRRNRVRRGSGRIDIEDALTAQEVARAIQAGRDAATADLDAGAEMLIGSVCGVGAGVAAAAIGAFLTGLEPVDAAGRGTGVDDDAWIRRATAVRDARYRLTVGNPDAATQLRVAGGADLAALTGFVLESALRGIPVLVDDIPGAVAAVLAHRFAPGAERYVLVPAPVPGVLHRRLLELLRTEPLTGLRLGGGIAGPSLLMVPLLAAATAAVDAAPAAAPGDRAPWAIDDWDAELL
ncbi:nicotinate-nucleotide--dimethylbenzimidazole phosphoribosyltransferase [Nakamurella lactea]|uniref:nicotinate-nucleotide--dimethylbenzimidazole phosphoribosyltransferase n=1 Tax=Nakamurella lactea TaxID=459515 RepID=UPI00040C9F1E|nr:nicotinate-nucleotide--dimethylbenzimidazole phosphoribosyltransferase [Nakamurella lactea]